MKLKYFGTNMDRPGHYIWDLPNLFMTSRISYTSLPFDPEGFPDLKEQKYIVKGYSDFHFTGGYTILAIAGSVADTRGGTKSVFFVNAELNKDDMIDLIMGDQTAMAIINKLKSLYGLSGILTGTKLTMEEPVL